MMRICLPGALLALLLASAVHGHTWLTQDSVDRMLGRMQAAVEKIEVGDAESRASALYELADAASGLTELLNEEFAAHGAERPELIMSAIDGAEALGVAILWSGPHNRFFYDGDAYRRYVGLAKSGEEDAEARYFLIENDFYLGDTSEKSKLEARIAEKEAFLERYPAFRERSRVELFLGIDHRDLWRLCRDGGDARCADEHARLAAERFRAVRDGNPDEEIGEVGERLLGRLEAERAQDQG